MNKSTVKNPYNVIYIDCPGQVKDGLRLFKNLKDAKILTSDPRTLVEIEELGYSVETFDHVYDEKKLHDSVNELLPAVYELFSRLDGELREAVPFIKQYDLNPMSRMASALALKLLNHAAALYICSAYLLVYPKTTIYIPKLDNYGEVYRTFDTWTDHNIHYVWAFHRLADAFIEYNWANVAKRPVKRFHSLWEIGKTKPLHQLKTLIKLFFSKKKGLYLHLDWGELSKRVKSIGNNEHLSIQALYTHIKPKTYHYQKCLYNSPGKSLEYMGVQLAELLNNDIQDIEEYFLQELCSLDSWAQSNPDKIDRIVGIVCNRSLFDPQLSIIAEYLCARNAYLLHYQHGGGYGAQEIPKFIYTDFNNIQENHIFCVWGESVKTYARSANPTSVPCAPIGWKSLESCLAKPTGSLDRVVYVPANLRYSGGGIRAFPYGDFPCTDYFIRQRTLLDALSAAGCDNLLIKMHPASLRPTPLERYAEKNGYQFTFAFDSLRNHLTPSTLYITDFTSTTYCEALAMGCTVIAYQDNTILKPTADGMLLMEKSSYVYKTYAEFIDAATDAIINPENFPPKENIEYLREYVFSTNGDEILEDTLRDINRQ